MQLTVNEDVMNAAEAVVLKYMSDQKRYPKTKGTPFVTTAAEFGNFLDTVAEANPALSDKDLNMASLRFSQDSSVADQLMAILNNAASSLTARGRGDVPPLPNMFDRPGPGQTPGRGA